MTKLYPMQFEPIYKEMVWGGTKMRSLGRNISSENTGESWDVACREKEMSVIANGPYKNQPFLDIINSDPEGILGRNHNNSANFPLLVKIIDANDFLSVQVHPDDSYANAVEGCPYGKNEMWYILDAAPESYLIIGLKSGVTKKDFETAVKEGNVGDCLSKLYVQPGDIINIPAGLLHAIGKGILLAEIQQNSDITYRVYDYNRKGLDGNPRELHVEKSIDVIDFTDTISKKPVKKQTLSQSESAKIEACIKSKFFTIQLYTINGTYTDASNPDCFYIFTCVEKSGDCIITYGETLLDIPLGGSVFIPAGMGSYKISGNCKLLKSFV